MTDDSWSMVEEAVFRLFDELAENGTGHVTVGSRLAELGWAEIEAEYPVAASELLFRSYTGYSTNPSTASCCPSYQTATSQVRAMASCMGLCWVRRGGGTWCRYRDRWGPCS